MINPYDLGKNIIAENCQKIDINKLIRIASKEIKIRIIKSQIELMGFKINLISSKTRFGGLRYWFLCPICNKRAGLIYKSPSNLVGCRKCLKIYYKKQRYKGMIEVMR